MAGSIDKKKCDWCKKNKSVEHLYYLGHFAVIGNEIKKWHICVDCNLKHDVV